MSVLARSQAELVGHSSQQQATSPYSLQVVVVVPAAKVATPTGAMQASLRMAPMASAPIMLAADVMARVASRLVAHTATVVVGFLKTEARKTATAWAREILL